MEKTLTENEKQRIQNIDLLVGSIVLIGSIGGAIYAKRTGGGFWRYVGYLIVGSLVTGIPARLVATPFKNKILKDSDKNNSGNMATKLDALKVVTILGEKDTPYTPQQVNKFVSIYTSMIDKNTHNNILIALSKKESEWSAQDKLYYSKLIEVINKLK